MIFCRSKLVREKRFSPAVGFSARLCASSIHLFAAGIACELFMGSPANTGYAVGIF